MSNYGCEVRMKPKLSVCRIDGQGQLPNIVPTVSQEHWLFEIVQQLRPSLASIMIRLRQASFVPESVRSSTHGIGCAGSQTFVAAIESRKFMSAKERTNGGPSSR